VAEISVLNIVLNFLADWLRTLYFQSVVLLCFDILAWFGLTTLTNNRAVSRNP